MIRQPALEQQNRMMVKTLDQVFVARAQKGLGCAPHFERMLYDNAQLARVCLHAWQVTDNEFFRTMTAEILDYAIREMTIRLALSLMPQHKGGDFMRNRCRRIRALTGALH